MHSPYCPLFTDYIDLDDLWGWIDACVFTLYFGVYSVISFGGLAPTVWMEKLWCCVIICPSSLHHLRTRTMVRNYFVSENDCRVVENVKMSGLHHFRAVSLLANCAALGGLGGLGRGFVLF